jgi:hypothetical protein
MFINISQIKTKKGVKNGLKYQTKNGRGKVLSGSPEMVKEWSVNSNSESVKAFSILISFRESQAELEEKLKKQGYTLDELIEDIENLLFAGYQREEIAYSMIAHSDTNHYHIHTYLTNNYAGTGKTIRFFFHENDLTAIKEFISLKYDLDLRTTPKAGRTRKVGSSHWKGEAKKKEEEKDIIHEAIMKNVIDGTIADNQQVRERMELYTELSDGTIKEVEVLKTPNGAIEEIDKNVKVFGNNVLIKLYKNSISIIKRDGLQFTLRGGIYRNDWTAQKNVLKVKEVLDNVIKYLERKMKETQRYDKDRQKRKAQQPKYQEEIMGKNLLTFLKQLRQQNQNQQQKQQPQKQPQNQQPQKQPQPQKQNQPSINNQQNLQDNQPEKITSRNKPETSRITYRKDIIAQDRE